MRVPYNKENCRMPWRFEQKPPGFWENQGNQKQFFDWLGSKLGYKEMDDWYKITQEDIFKYGGRGLLKNYYSNSPSKALKAVYSKHYWIPWKFVQTPNGLWCKQENHAQFFNWMVMCRL